MQPDHQTDLKQCRHHRRYHRGVGDDAHQRTRRSGPGSPRAKCDAKTPGQGLSMSAERHNAELIVGRTASPVRNERLKIVFVGHVDHGKSTLIGRLLYDTNSLAEGKLAQVERACAAEGMEFEFAFLLDALLEEQQQNITIDTTQIPFRTPRREYAIIDAPGHKEFLKNMITGASNADVAILVIAASEGVREQSRRHAYLLSLLGIQQIIVVVNKMDLIDFAEDQFRQIKSEYLKFLSGLKLEPRGFIPASARTGDNVAKRSSRMKWYHGSTLLEALDAAEANPVQMEQPLRFCV